MINVQTNKNIKSPLVPIFFGTSTHGVSRVTDGNRGHLDTWVFSFKGEMCGKSFRVTHTKRVHATWALLFVDAGATLALCSV